MGFDIKAKVEEIIKKIQGDPDMMNNFQKDPTKTVEGLVGVDLPDDQINPVVDAVKAKLTVDNLGGIAGKLGGLFGGKKDE